MVPVVYYKGGSVIWALLRNGEEIGIHLKDNRIIELPGCNEFVDNHEWIEENEKEGYSLFAWVKEKDFTVKGMKRLFPELWL